jgi:nicotinate-nucleotide pyrophosphorylase (carboxylating)
MPDLNALPLPDLYLHLASTGLVRRLFELARDEDLGPGRTDVTSDVSVSPEAQASAHIVARMPGRLAGLAALPELLNVFGAAIILTPLTHDGDQVPAKSPLARLAGPKREILTIERTMLNLIGHLSGIATTAAAFLVAVGSGLRAKVYDTRKTMPGLRVLEKYAVRCGGANCHRIGLYDAVLIKDNHIAGVPLDSLARAVADASRRARARAELSFFEVEVDTLDQFARILTIEPGLVDVVLLDNMTPIQVRQAVSMRDKAASRIELEASGGVRLETIRTIAETGVDRISAGAITHSASWLDVALDIDG